MRINILLCIKATLLILFFTAMGRKEAVAQSITDTVFVIQDIVISAPRSQHFRNDLKTDIFLKDELSFFAGESLGRFLISNAAVNVRSYGAGGAASTVTLRGTSAGHLQVNWNGFPINSVTLGSCDFSMIPADGFDRISIVYGAPGALYGSGTFGGAINLDSNLKPGKALDGSAQASYESLKTIVRSASFHVGNDKFAWKMNTWGSDSENEFTYYDYIRKSQLKQTDGDWSDAGIIQQVILQLPSSTLEAGMWYQVKDYNIPSRIGSTSYEYQKDSTLKLFAAYKKTSNHWGLQIKAALFNDEQGYFQKASTQSAVYSIESHINTIQSYGDVNLRYYLRPHFSIDAGITGRYILADVSAYMEKKAEKGLTVFTGIKYDKNRLSCQTGIQKEWNNIFHSGLLPSFGIAWKVMPDKWTFRANISQKFRKPTYNDLYWIPGGNPDLKPETGYSVDVGSLVNLMKKGNIKVSADIGFYWSEIKDMIVWCPAGAYWIARNYQRVGTAGMDANLLFDIKRERWKYHSSLMVMLNHSTLKSYTGDEREMLYTPRVITTWLNRFSTGIFEFNLWHHFTADRLYDESSLLDPYQIFNIQTGVKIPVWKGKMGLYITVNNLINSTYELIRLYPMPGRYWSVKMSYTF